MDERRKVIRRALARIKKAIKAGQVYRIYWDDGQVIVEFQTAVPSTYRGAEFTADEATLGLLLIELLKIPDSKCPML